MKFKTAFLLYVILPISLFFAASEIWVRYEGLVETGLDRVVHPYISIGGFYKGGLFNKSISINNVEAPDAFGYESKGFLNIPSYRFGTDIHSAGERGRFLYRDRAGLVISPKPKGEFRIFILGGSVAFGEGAKQLENRWYVRLEEQLRKKTGRNVVVISAANHSHVTTQERIVYKLYVSPYQPDAAIFLDGFNDANTASSATRPGDPYGQGIIYIKDMSPLYGLINDVSKHSAFVRYLLQNHLSAIWSGNNYTPDQIRQQAISVSNVYYDNLTQLNRRCGNEKIKCFFFLQPYRNLSESRRNLPASPDESNLADSYSEILHQLPRHPFVIDYTGAFDNGPANFPFFDRAHFNDEGHIYLAAKMADDLIKRGLFK